MSSPVILLLAGEPSGDLHAAAVARELRRRYPSCRLIGTGGEKLAAEGVELLASLDDLAVMGFVEVAARLSFFRRLERQVIELLRTEGVDLVLPVDYPGFNLRITRSAHRMGLPVVYYIAPQVWAWKAGRAARLAREADRIAVILPFEEELFLREGGRASFVGHPLLEERREVRTREPFCRASGLDPDRPILAIFPGSRSQEVRRHLEPFLEAGELLRDQCQGLQIAVARAPGLSVPLPTGQDIRLVEEGFELLHHARAALVKSGTTTLEAALAGTPFIVAYRTHPLTFQLARRLVRVDHVALANLVGGGRIVPEFLQEEVEPERLAGALLPLLRDSAERGDMIEGLRRIRDRLGTPGAAGRVVDLVEAVLEERKATGGITDAATRGSARGGGGDAGSKGDPIRQGEE